MANALDREHRLREQYKHATVLDARFQLYRRFSTNNWHRWIFDQFKLAPTSRILEVGCGAGYLWLENRDRIPRGWAITLSDFSPGMVRAARHQLNSVPHPFCFAVVDARHIPFPADYFDAVIANHMLYHIKPNRAQALAEIRRVLKPGGRLYATTNGQNHLRELKTWIGRFNQNPTTDRRKADAEGLTSDKFRLENGLDQLAPWFAHVTIMRHDNVLIVTEAEPVAAHVRSKQRLDPDQLAAFAEWVEAQIALRGALRITTDAGLFEAYRAEDG